jgi:DNA-binding beta-propeller fold protein YncE
MKPYFAVLLLLCLAGCHRSAEKAGPAAAVSQVWGEEGSLPGQFKGPRAITAARDGYVYVVDRASQLSKFHKDGKFAKRWLVPVASAGRSEGPEGIAMFKNGDIAVTNTHAARVLIYSNDGKLIRSFGQYGMGRGQFLLVTGACVDKDDYLYLADYGGAFDRISKWTKEGKIVASWPGHGEGPRQFRRPCGLAISKDGDLLVADIGNHRIQILDRQTGAYKGQFGPRGRKDGQLTYPYGVAVDGKGQIYTVEYGTHRVQKWTSDGKWIASWGGPGRGLGQFANPWGISVDPDGTVYVADTNNNRVQKFSFPPQAPAAGK